MFILSEDNRYAVNTKYVRNYVADKILWADDVKLCECTGKDQSLKILNEIFTASQQLSECAVVPAEVLKRNAERESRKWAEEPLTRWN